MDREEKKKLISILRNLNETEICFLFYEILSPLKKERAAFDEIDDAYCIAVCGYSDRDGVYEADFWALPKESMEMLSTKEIEQGASQYGVCDRCHAPVVCLRKIAICPICGSEVNCT